MDDISGTNCNSKRNRLLKQFSKRKTDLLWRRYKNQRNYTTWLIREAKTSYYCKLNNKLSDPSLGPKKWWNYIKFTLNNNNNHTSIPPIKEGAEIVFDSKEKADLFNDYFVNQSRINDSNCQLPLLTYFQSDKTLSIIHTTEREVLMLLEKVDISKACGPDGIGNKILKLSSNGIKKSFTNLLNLSFQKGEYPTEWKRANVSPIYKKDNHQYKENYRPISLLPSISKISEKIVFARLYEFLLEIHFLSDFQSGFRPGDSTVNQLTYIVHIIYQALDMGKEVRMVFLDFTKAFDKVWHKGLLYKLQTLGLKDPLLSWFRSYLTDRKQRVVIDGQTSSWSNTEAGVPQGSVLGPLLFLIYINDIGVDIVSNCFLYADDTSLFDITDDPTSSASKLNLDLDKISQWCKQWLMELNPSKCESITFSRKLSGQTHPTLHLDGNALREVNSHTHLGLKLTSNFTWNHHIQSIHKKASKMMNLLKSVKYKLHRSTLISLYKSLVRPLMEYADVIWDGCTESEANLLEGIQNESARIVTGAMKGTNRVRLLNELCWEDLKTRRFLHKLSLLYKIINCLTPSYLRDLLPPYVYQRSDHHLRSNENFTYIPTSTERFKKSFFPSVIAAWNELDNNLCNVESLLLFKSKLYNAFYGMKYNTLYNTSLNRYSSILHSRLRLGHCALNSYLCSINCAISPYCKCRWGIVESIKHFFLHCPRYAAQRQCLLSSSAQLLHTTWLSLLEDQIVETFLYGSQILGYEDNQILMRNVQLFILQTKRFIN